MKILNTILLTSLILLSVSTGTVKLLKMPEEMILFRGAGFPDALTIVFGVIQLAGGVLIAFKKMRKEGAFVMVITFVIATIVVFINNMVSFGIFSILFIILAAYFLRTRTTAF